MKYFELTVETTAEYEDILTDILICNGSEGVEIKNTDEIARYVESKFNFDYYDDTLLEQADEVVVKAFFSSESSVSAAIAAIQEEKQFACVPTGSLATSVREFDDSEYKDVWKQFYSPIDFGCIVVVPKWMEHDKEPRLLLDPGCAFGTGSHHTTAMCLDALNRVGVAGKTVADIGCGSGILGLSALVLGADRATLSDIDEDALQNARENAGLNGLTDRCTFASGDLFAGENGKFDIIFANIVADVLIRLCPMLPKRVAEGGEIIMSGILDRRLPEVESACLAVGLKIVESRLSGEWVMLRCSL